MGIISFLEKKFRETSKSKFVRGRKIPPQTVLSKSTKTIAPFSIIPWVYESELDKKYGINLESLKNGEASGFQGDLESNVSFNSGYTQCSKKIEDRILKKYESLPDFCSMSVSELEELLDHVKKIHELSYNHYAWAKENDLEGQFPNYCCGSSSRNLFLTLMDKGYPNSSFVYNPNRDHAYVLLPFVFGENNQKGFIIVDPTSDQLFDDKKNAPRNNLFVVSGTKGNYETDWNSGQDLYPGTEDESTFANLHTLRNNHSCSIYEKEGMDEYFSEVFENVLEIDVEKI